MRERRIIGVIVLLTVLVSVSLVFGLGVVDIARLSSTPMQPTAGTTTVFVEPPKIIDETKQSGPIAVSLNISDVDGLYAWQVNVTWTPNPFGANILNFTGIVSYGAFLSQTTSPDGTSSIYDIFAASNETGYAVIAESILGDVGGIPGPDGGGLVTVEFEIVGYGYTHLTISSGGALPTLLLDSVGGSITIGATADGVFDNRLPGDCDGDTDCDYDDLIVLAGAYGASAPAPAYNEDADFDHDGDVDYDDLIKLAGNYGTSL